MTWNWGLSQGLWKAYYKTILSVNCHQVEAHCSLSIRWNLMNLISGLISQQFTGKTIRCFKVEWGLIFRTSFVYIQITIKTFFKFHVWQSLGDNDCCLICIGLNLNLRESINIVKHLQFSWCIVRESNPVMGSNPCF